MCWRSSEEHGESALIPIEYKYWMKFAVFLQEECNGDGDGKTDYSDEATVEEEVLLLLPWGGV